MGARGEAYYDFRPSVRELQLKPSQKIDAVLRAFDADGDERLVFEEAAKLWAATTSNELTETQYTAACCKVDVDPAEGLDSDALAKLYKEGLADLDTHFAAVQAIAMKPKPKKNAAQSSSGAQDEIAAEDDDDGDEDEWEDASD